MTGLHNAAINGLVQNTEAFKQFLQDELLRRAKKNPRFSIRAFARQLAVEPSSLAQILSGKRPLTERMCARIADKLSLRPSRVRSLLKGAVRPAAQFTTFHELSEDAFQVIADWHYYAILELTRVRDFKPSIPWIARVLGLPAAVIVSSIERLKKLGYLRVDAATGQWVDHLGSAVNHGNQNTAPAFREHQRQILAKAQEALDNIPYEERVQSSMTLVGSRDRVAEAKRRILTFIEELDEFMKSTDAPEEVYSLSVSLFPLSQVTQTQTPKTKKESV